jgi:hypothetical protein
MAHWAELDENNVVVRITVGNNHESDEGYQWLIDNLGGRWVQTSYNANFRKNYAGIGCTYDETLDAFIPAKPYESWILNQDTYKWQPPTPMPTEGAWYWNEENTEWVEVIDDSNEAESSPI